jgi:hypothetical protein
MTVVAGWRELLELAACHPLASARPRRARYGFCGEPEPRRAGDGTSARARDSGFDYGASARSSASAGTQTSKHPRSNEAGRAQAAILKS